MTFLLQTALLARRRILETLRQPIWVLMGLSVPLMYLAPFAPLLKPLAGGPGFPGGSVLDVFVPGILALMAFGSGMGAGWIVIGELEFRRHRTAAGHPGEPAGPGARDGPPRRAHVVVPAALVLVVATPFGFDPHWGGARHPARPPGPAHGGVLGRGQRPSGSRSNRSAAWPRWSPVCSSPSPCSPACSSRSHWGRGLQGLAHANPMYYAVEAARALASGTLASATVAEGFGVTGAAALLAIWWGTRAYRRAMA